MRRARALTALESNVPTVNTPPQSRATARGRRGAGPSGDGTSWALKGRGEAGASGLDAVAHGAAGTADVGGGGELAAVPVEERDDERDPEGEQAEDLHDHAGQ